MTFAWEQGFLGQQGGSLEQGKHQSGNLSDWLGTAEGGKCCSQERYVPRVLTELEQKWILGTVEWHQQGHHLPQQLSLPSFDEIHHHEYLLC